MKIKINLLCCSFIFCLVGCSEFIEPSLSGAKVTLLDPADHLESNVYKQVFWWEKVNDTSKYRLQIASPSFSVVSKLVLDTLISSDKFSFDMSPGTYQWRVRVQNTGSQSSFVTSDIIIHLSSFADQSVQVVNPVTMLSTSTNNIQFEWLGVFGATQYRLQIDNKNFADAQNLITDVITDKLSISKKVSAEGTYNFRVRPENLQQNSKWSQESFIYDITPPEKVQLLYPANKQVAALPVKLSWLDLPDAEKYELYVYKIDSTTLFSASYPQVVGSNSQNFIENVNETLVWKVRALDKAGNKGAFGQYFSFSIL
jgi:hypothetical protein